MKLTKTSQKIDNNVCKALTVACEEFLHDISGFKWLTHRANYTNFPASLVITCVFECEADVETMKAAKQDDILRNAIQKQLLKVGVVAKNIKQQVHFDTEESCEAQHQGDWTSRLALNVVKQKFNMKKAH